MSVVAAASDRLRRWRLAVVRSGSGCDLGVVGRGQASMSERACDGDNKARAEACFAARTGCVIKVCSRGGKGRLGGVGVGEET